ncbi:hypothetical protein Aab01nite_62780 [Paractinoplanes abujensis]|uniref:Ig-like domain-containing protein n=1 Tax=Paractinoplanes abujensis TaxID=882441 RepID=A0A7W7G070_9ACTN|nr:hypothetical protein [Actinoplanes abujensis]MBB4692813.1 hypothetical protein [Actinoplanes abujensis]GID22688.1 hypothetical protein Aab01nite_62780 [Actinoplanes abujensis]
MPRILAAAGVLLAAVLVPAGAAQAAVTCAPDAYEIDDSGQNAAPIAAGETVHRAICQERTPLPGKPYAHDIDLFEFTAVEGQAYTAEVVGAGAQLANNGAGAGGLTVGISGPDGTGASVEQTFSIDGDLVVTGPLHAGRYRVVAATMDQEIYPEDNVITTRTVQGDAGRYGVRLTATAPAPVVTGLTVSPNPVNGGKNATATLTFSSPAPRNGLIVNLSSSNAFVAGNVSSSQVPPGATRYHMTIRTGRVSADTPVTFTAKVAHVGQPKTAVLTVRR